MGDPTRLRQVIINLIANALKFTHKGEVLLDVERQPADSHSVLLHFRCRDTGIGIPAEKQRVIFDSFSQVDSSITRKFGGTGLGLAISSRLVHLMSGNIWVESELNRGSTFHFTTRLQLPAQHLAEPSPPASLQNVPVLIVDDNDTNRRLLQETVSAWGMKPFLASSGAEGLALLRQLQDSLPLLLTDANMPEMDGFTLVETIRAQPAFRHLRIIMLTSTGLRGEAARCRHLNVGAYLTKPIDALELHDAILRICAGAETDVVPREQQVVTRHSLRESAGASLSCLVAEDNPVNRALIARLLEKRGHHVVLVTNGREALQQLERKSFDLVLMEVQMPEMGGLEATAAIREREKSSGAHVPIVALTAGAIKGDEERCLASGMDAHLSKPINIQKLFSLIQTVITDSQRPDLPPQD